MKKLIITTIFFALILSITTVADSIDLSTLSDDELTDLKLKVETEYSSRGLDDCVILELGVYKVGEDIKAGSYVFTGFVDLDVKNGIAPGEICCYTSVEDFDNNEIPKYTVVTPGSPVRITFEDGMVFEEKIRFLV